MSKKTIIAIVSLVFGLILFFALSPFVSIGTGQRGVVTMFGKVDDRVLVEGVHWINPLADVIKFNVQTQKVQVGASAASKDLQTVSATVALNYELEPSKVNRLYQEIGKAYDDRIIQPALQEAVKAATAKYTAEELITKRGEVAATVKATLAERLTRNFINVVDLSIINFDFSPEFNKAIEEKQTAQQKALKAKNDLERVKAEAEQRVAQAQAEAEAIRIQSQAVTSQGGQAYVELKALEVQEKAVAKWNGQLPTQMLPNSTVPFIDITK